MDQLTFDIDQMIHELDIAALPDWAGAPLHFTADYHSPAELVEAFDHWKFVNGNQGSIPRSHMWHPAYTEGHANGNTPGHDLYILTADARCRSWNDFKGLAAECEASGKCSCIGSLIYQANCATCRWHRIGDHSEVIEAWHDHAWPGWRDLPVIPNNIAGKKRNAWIETHYPVEWQTEGAPILTERDGIGTRHVCGRSPWAGFDLSAT